MVSAQGAMAGSGGMAYGNAIGSIICNTALIAAITVAIKPGKIERKTLILPVGFFFAAAIFYMCVAYLLGEFSRTVGIILICGFVVYMATLVFTMLKGKKNEIEPLEDATHDDGAESEESEEGGFSLKSFIIELLCVGIGGGFMIYKGGIIRYIGIVAMAVFAVYAVIAIIMAAKKKGFSMGRDILFLVIGAGIIAGGANLLVDSGIYIATEFGVPETVIALTFVALGTSLPELVTAITSLVKGHGALSLGNVIGANLFNLVLVSGVSTVISPFGVPAESQIGGVPASYVLDLPVMLGVMLLLTVPALIRGKLSRVQGILLLCVYIGFCAMQFIM
ncbi:MAG: sodium:calcium antiporter [Clostridia bacterium]|nr:sodium:calcium antiporter [Clostridia bacterium]